MKMPGAPWKNCAILSAICCLNLLASAVAQPAGNGATNTAPVQPLGTAAPTENVITNQSFDQELSTNTAFLPPEPMPVYGARPVPNEFEAQNNAPVSVGPSYLGGGQPVSPVTGTGVFGPPGFVPSSGEGIYHSGLLNVHAGLAYSFVYGTGIQDQPGQKSSTVVQVVSPYVELDLGQHLSLSYSPMLTYYSGNSGLGNSTGEGASLSWSESYQDWAFRLSQSYSFTSAPLIETGTQTSEEDYVTGVNVSHMIGNGFSLTLGLNQDFRDANQFNDLSEWSASGSINYMLNPKVQIGLNVGGGLDEVSDSPNETFESYSVVLMARPGPKTTVNLSVGLEEQSFDASGVSTSTTPIYSASIRYQLFKGTALILDGTRVVSPSFFSNLLSTATSVDVTLRQNLSQKLVVQLFGAYANNSYQAIEPGGLPKYFLTPATATSLQVTRTDNTSSIGVGLNYTFTRRLFGSVYYTYSKNSASQGDYNFSSSQFAVQLAYRY
jgi:hypothetical protein